MVVEKFHVRSENTTMVLTVELHFRLTEDLREIDHMPVPNAASVQT